MEDFAHGGDFYTNEACPDYDKLQIDQPKKNNQTWTVPSTPMCIWSGTFSV